MPETPYKFIEPEEWEVFERIYDACKRDCEICRDKELCLGFYHKLLDRCRLITAPEHIPDRVGVPGGNPCVEGFEIPDQIKNKVKGK